jgi:kumamolisin
VRGPNRVQFSIRETRAYESSRSLDVCGGGVVVFLVSARFACAQLAWTTAAGTVVIPNSSIEKPGDAGFHFHTNVGVLLPHGTRFASSPGAPSSLISPMVENPYEVQPLGKPPVAGFLVETPASLGCVYNVVSPVVPGCNPNTVTANPTGGSKVIAIVDAYAYPSALSDLKMFSTQFSLAAPTAANFQVVFAEGTPPPDPTGGGWVIEQALDIEWAHAFAPAAKIVLVEAKSRSSTDLIGGVDVAANLVAAAAGGEESNGWGASEFAGELNEDSNFKKPKVVYFAAAGDSPGVEYPASSPFVVSVGGTSTARNLSTGAFFKEVAWQDTGGGLSAFEPRPSYQNAVLGIVGAVRGTPDVSGDAADNNPVWVYAKYRAAPRVGIRSLEPAWPAPCGPRSSIPPANFRPRATRS